jgi:hypothetical protein
MCYFIDSYLNDGSREASGTFGECAQDHLRRSRSSVVDQDMEQWW